MASMSLTYLEKKYHILWILLLVILFLMGWWPLFALLLISYLGFGFFYRRHQRDFQESRQVSQGIVLSPVNGVVKSIRSDIDHPVFGPGLKEIQIILPWWKEWGVRLPIQAAIDDCIVKEQLPVFRYALQDAPEDGSFLKLATAKGDKIGLQFVRCFLGMPPSLITLPGDRGIGGANLGYFPFGGTVLVYLGHNYEIMVNINDHVTSGESPLAGG